MSNILLKNTKIVNEGKVYPADLLIKNQRIEKIASSITKREGNTREINCNHNYLIPGMIDDQVHFRDPGLTHKASLETDSQAALAGGITSFMDMPNTIPNVLTQEILEEKYNHAKDKAWGNFSFYMGTSNENSEEVLKTNPKNVCGVKIFMGSSTGNMLVDNKKTLNHIFKNCETLIATHCEDEATILRNSAQFRSKYDLQVPSPIAGGVDLAKLHPQIRSEEACFLSSQLAVSIAKEHGTRLHVLHLTTEKEIQHFVEGAVENKNITGEVCVHHLWFDENDYGKLGNKIKCNPAIKKETDKLALRKAVLATKLDVIATDHAPHLLKEKNENYWNSPAGLPLVQAALPTLFELVEQGVFSIEKIVEMTSHNVAKAYKIKNRGFIREGMFADLALIDHLWQD